MAIEMRNGYLAFTEEKPDIRKIVYLNGRPSTGKDTQADFIVEKYGGIRESTGDMGRLAELNQEPYARYYDHFKPHFETMHKGEMVPDEVYIPVVEDVIHRHFANGKKVVVFTGFPRTPGQVNSIDTIEHDLARTESGLYVVGIHITLAGLESTSRERRLLRIEAGEDRKDDREDVFNNRLVVYKGPTSEAIRKLLDQKRMNLVKANRTKEEIFTDVCSIIDSYDNIDLIKKAASRQTVCNP